MKIIAIYMLTLLLSFNALAIGSWETQIPRLSNSLTVLQKSRAIPLPQKISTLDSVEQTSTHKQDEIFTEIFVYLLIVMVYSLYWHNLSQHIDK